MLAEYNTRLLSLGFEELLNLSEPSHVLTLLLVLGKVNDVCSEVLVHTTSFQIPIALLTPTLESVQWPSLWNAISVQQ